jgi:hypothetical protein
VPFSAAREGWPQGAGAWPELAAGVRGRPELAAGCGGLACAGRRVRGWPEPTAGSEGLGLSRP